jgi:enamine deaminase RidA (YjgF/YER057c/UK114 family)
MTSTRLQLARERAAPHGFDLAAPLQIGGNYSSITEHNGTVYVSGQVPRIGSTIVSLGRVGEEVSLAQARAAAEVCALRVLAILEQSYGLDRIKQVLKVNVFVQAAGDFTQASEVADAASDLLVAVLGDSGRHARTAVGVYRLPKNAPVELDLTAALL